MNRDLSPSSGGVREPMRLRKWDSSFDVVSIHLTRRPDDGDMVILNSAISAFVRALTSDGAHLISAAPDMFAAIATLCGKYKARDFPGYMHDDWEALEAAIAKAVS